MRILIAEDEPISRRLLASKLRKWGHEVIVAGDGLAAWQELQSAEAPQLAILDWMMPGIDGVQICREVRRRADGPYIYLLLLTAKDQKEDLVEGMAAGADDYLTKPFDTHELRVRINAGVRILDLQSRLISALEALREQATHDSLTRLWNHSAILDFLRGELSRVQRDTTSVGVILADLDHFKQINDTYGHQAGDQVLREVAQRMREVVRPYDQIGRYGGEEFLIVLPGCDSMSAIMVADRLRACVESPLTSLGTTDLAVTMSLGLAFGGSQPVSDPSALVRAADLALYQAKDRGRNCCVVAPSRDLLDDRLGSEWSVER